MRWGLGNGGSLITIKLLMELFSTDTKIKRNTQYLGSGFHFTWCCQVVQCPPHQNHSCSTKHTHSFSRTEAPLWHHGISRQQCCSCKLHPMAGTAQPWGAASQDEQGILLTIHIVISSWLECLNKEETEGENISSLTETKNGLKVAKGKKTGVDGQGWRY